MTTGFVYESSFAQHTHPKSPESSIRLEKLIEYLNKSEVIDSLEKIKIETIPWEWILSSHTKYYVDKVIKFCLYILKHNSDYHVFLVSSINLLIVLLKVCICFLEEPNLFRSLSNDRDKIILFS